MSLALFIISVHSPPASGRFSFWTVACCPVGRKHQKAGHSQPTGQPLADDWLVWGMQIQRPWPEVGSTGTYTLHSRVPLWGRASATLCGTSPEIATLLLSPGSTALVNKPLHVHECLSRGSALAGPTYKESQSSFNSEFSNFSNLR